MTVRAPLSPAGLSRPDTALDGAEGRIIDADFLVLDPLHTHAKEALLGAPKPPPALGLPAGLGALRTERRTRRPFGQRGGWGFWLGGLSLAAASFWVSGGHALFLPGRAAPAPEAPLTLALVTSGTEKVGGRSVLRVEAEARNGSERARALPPLSILVTTGKGAAMRYNVQPPLGGIGPNGRQRISTRLPVPADGVSAVRIAFAQ